MNATVFQRYTMSFQRCFNTDMTLSQNCFNMASSSVKAMSKQVWLVKSTDDSQCLIQNPNIQDQYFLKRLNSKKLHLRCLISSEYASDTEVYNIVFLKLQTLTLFCQLHKKFRVSPGLVKVFKGLVNLVIDILNSERSNQLIETKPETSKKQHQSNNLVNNLD